MSDKKISEFIYTGIFNSVIYLLAALSTVLSAVEQNMLFYYIMLILFVIWDLGFSTLNGSFQKRGKDIILEQITLARTTLSYFLALHGLMIGYLLSESVKNDANSNRILSMVVNAKIDVVLFVIPILLSAVAMLFVPVQHVHPNRGTTIAGGETNKNKQGEITASLKMTFFIVILMQKIVIFTTAFIPIYLIISNIWWLFK